VACGKSLLNDAEIIQRVRCLNVRETTYILVRIQQSGFSDK